MASEILTGAQVLSAIRRLEPRHPLTYQQLRDLERRGCVAPRAMRGGRAPRVYELGDVLVVRLLARMQADPLLARWQAWSVVAHLRDALREVLLSSARRTLVVQGAVGRIVSAKDAATMTGVDFDLAAVRRGVATMMRAASGEVWTGAQWVSGRVARQMAQPLELVR